jgi:hypothetical protein
MVCGAETRAKAWQTHQLVALATSEASPPQVPAAALGAYERLHPDTIREANLGAESARAALGWPPAAPPQEPARQS